MFRVYAAMDQRLPLSKVAAHAQRAEGLGYDGLSVPEAVHDGLLSACIALHGTTRLVVATGVLVAFPRSPMAVAHAAWDLQEHSRGRFGLGLGSQVRGNIVGRYSTAWAPPVPRMREYVGALRAIFHAWQHGGEFRFEGEHYRFTRMQPFFRPEPLNGPEIPIYLGGIGATMVALAGEVADGLLTHPTNTCPRYLQEVIVPQLKKGAARSGRDAANVKVMATPLIATGRTQAAANSEREKIRQLLAFLYSTPAYWPSLELFGWKERGERLRRMAADGQWGEMAALISDEMLDAFVPTAPYAEIAGVLRQAYAGLADWVVLPMPADPSDDAEVAKAVARLREG